MKAHPIIGVIDGGVGGFTVLKELLAVCPNAHYIYCGDSLNTPYSKKPRDKTVQYICEILDFLESKEVDVVAVACNAMSSLLDEYRGRYDFAIIDVISPVAEYLAKSDYKELVILSTELTKKEGLYPKLITAANPNIRIYSLSTAKLPMLLNNGPELTDELKEEIGSCLDSVEEQAGVSTNVVMACTHFPLVKDYMSTVKPHMNFMDPAVYQAKKVKEYLNGRLCEFKLDVFTNGDPEVYVQFLNHCNIKVPFETHRILFKQ